MTHPNIHRGTIVPMVTPFTEELALDDRAAEGMVDRLATHRLGAFVLGTTGEAASVPQPMRDRLVEIAVKAANKRVPVYAGIGDNCVLDSIDSARRYLELGVDAVVAPLPSYYTLSPAEMLDYFELLSEQISGPIVGYNIPPTTHMSIPVEVVKRISELDNVVGFKDSENAPGRLEALAELGKRDDFSIFMGVARLSHQAMLNGYDGLVPSSGNIVPQLWELFDSLAREEDWISLQNLQTTLDQLAAIFQTNRTLGQSLAALKTGMAAIGQCQRYVLPPLQPLPESEIAVFGKYIEPFSKVSADSYLENT